MMGKAVVPDAQRLVQLSALRRDDPDIVEIILSCAHAALYVLETDATVHWRKIGIEGFFYVVKRFVIVCVACYVSLGKPARYTSSFFAIRATVPKGTSSIRLMMTSDSK